MREHGHKLTQGACDAWQERPGSAGAGARGRDLSQVLLVLMHWMWVCGVCVCVHGQTHANTQERLGSGRSTGTSKERAVVCVCVRVRESMCIFACMHPHTHTHTHTHTGHKQGARGGHKQGAARALRPQEVGRQGRRPREKVGWQGALGIGVFEGECGRGHARPSSGHQGGWRLHAAAAGQDWRRRCVRGGRGERGWQQ